LVDAPSSGGGVLTDVLVRIQSRAQKPSAIVEGFCFEHAGLLANENNKKACAAQLGTDFGIRTTIPDQ
jgi:hypothetical protein